MYSSSDFPPDAASQRFSRFVLRNKITSFLALVAVIVFLQIAFLPYREVGELRTMIPTETAFMREYAERARELGHPFIKSQTRIALSRIPRYVLDAVVVAEDGTFWSHAGFDWFEFKESVERNLEEGRAARGASTITQQLVKNLYLSPSKNPLRKIKEWILTWYMERTLRKSRILEVYLNVIEWGEGIYGIEAASQHYFGKPAAELTREEGARLAAIIPSPHTHRPDGDSPYVIGRAKLILERMEARGMGPSQDIIDPSSRQVSPSLHPSTTTLQDSSPSLSDTL